MIWRNTCICLTAAAALAAASPVDIELAKRQWSGTISKEFSTGGCRDVIFPFARGSQEAGNMGTIVGPPLSNGLKLALGPYNVATEGMDYYGLVDTNYLRGGCDPGAVNAMIATLVVASSLCPNSVLVAGGYSQGAAACHRAIEYLPSDIKDSIAGVVTFGDTQTLQDNGGINYFPKDKVKIICNDYDYVCDGTLIVNMPVHLDYTRRVPEAVQFLTQKISNAQAKSKSEEIPPQKNITATIETLMGLTAPLINDMVVNGTMVNSTEPQSAEIVGKGLQLKKMLADAKTNLTASKTHTQ